MRIAICGAPNTGKTYLSNTMPRPVFHTDDLIGRTDWTGQSAEVAEWMEMPGPWVIEGVSVIRAIRKFIKAHPGEKPCDKLLIMTCQYVPLNPGQARMASTINKHLAEVEPQLLALGVRVQRIT